MRLNCMFTAVLASISATAFAATSVSPSQAAYAKATAAGLKPIIKLPGDPQYEQSVSSYWAETSQLRPWLIAQPRSTKDVALLIKIINEVPNLQFAVRSGGHMNWAGANNIKDGVTIDLSLLDSVSYNPTTKLASLGPGGHWRNVYEELDKAGVVVAGGRDGNVGVGGFFIGGGNSYFAVRKGMSSDTVRNYEVVLASGDIINVNKTSYPDLFVALKGGGSNFGIVTRFDVDAFPATPLWGGYITFPSSVSGELSEAFTTLTAINNDHLDSTFIGICTHNPLYKAIVTHATVFNIDGVADSPVFDEVRAIQPQLASSLNYTTMTAASRSLVLPPGEFASWYTMTYKNDVELTKYMFAQHEELVAYLNTIVPDSNFTTQLLFQPIPTIFGDLGAAAGGNVLGLQEQVPDDAILLLFACSLLTEAQWKLAVPKMNTLFARMQDKAAAAGKLYKWEYLNYANPIQNPLASYGAKNVAKIKAAAKKYDPKEFFQKRMPGGWKISKV